MKFLDLREEAPLHKYILMVSIAHIFLLLFISLASLLKDSLFFSKNKALQVLRSSVRVDLVALPKMTLKELRQMNFEEEATPFAPPPGGQGSENFLKKIQAFSQKKISVKKMKNPKKSSSQVWRAGVGASSRKALKKLLLEGNKLSEGASLTGRVQEGSLSELNRYMESLPQFVRPHWVLPSYLKEKQLQCRIRVFIDRRGQLVKAEIFQSSGDEQYDQHALSAVRQAELPEPKEEILKELLGGVVILGFPL